MVRFAYASSAFWGRFGKRKPRCNAHKYGDHKNDCGDSHAPRESSFPDLCLAPERAIECKEVSVAFGTVRDVMPVRIVLDGAAQWTDCQLPQDRVPRTALPLWIRVISEDRVLKLLLESVEFCFRRLFRRHQSMSLWH